jgi:hypothetical protein
VSYIEEFAAAAATARDVLVAKDIAEVFCNFTTEPAPEPNLIRVPPQALTKFQMEQALGDWAEGHVKDAINRSSETWKAVAFGDSDKTF